MTRVIVDIQLEQIAWDLNKALVKTSLHGTENKTE
jgi:hypothetical protein